MDCFATMCTRDSGFRVSAVPHRGHRACPSCMRGGSAHEKGPETGPMRGCLFSEVRGAGNERPGNIFRDGKNNRFPLHPGAPKRRASPAKSRSGDCLPCAMVSGSTRSDVVGSILSCSGMATGKRDGGGRAQSKTNEGGDDKFFQKVLLKVSLQQFGASMKTRIGTKSNFQRQMAKSFCSSPSA